MTTDILIIDDETDIREVISGILTDEGYQTRTGENSDEALQAILLRRPHLIFLDIWLQGSKLDGLQLLDIIRKQHTYLPIVMISGHGNIETAVLAVKLGAYDFIEKPFKADRLILVAQRALEASRLRRENQELRASSAVVHPIIGKSGSMNQLRQTIERLATTNARVMISGPSGVGKELVARTIHTASSRAEGPFVIFNSSDSNIPMLEEELFGKEDGNGNLVRVGIFEEAHGGILYLDEIGTLPNEIQNKILKALTEQSFFRVNGTQRLSVDIRILSSSSKDITDAIAQNILREDLFHRLAVVLIRIPPLAEHREDIPELIDFFMDYFSTLYRLPKRYLASSTLAILQAHDWPGNIRQLRNNVERILILAQGDPSQLITPDILPAEVGARLPSTPRGEGGIKLMELPLREARELFEKEYLMAQINRFSGNISKTAEFIEMERSALHRKLKALGID